MPANWIRRACPSGVRISCAKRLLARKPWTSTATIATSTARISHGRARLLLLGGCKAGLRAGYSLHGHGRVHPEGRIHALLRSTLKGGTRALDVDFFGGLGGVGQH